MNTRRITLTLGAATGGLLAAGFLSMGVASAAPAVGDTVDPFGTASNPTIIADNGILPDFQDAVGTQTFDIDDTTVGTSTTPDVVGTATYDYSQWQFPGGATNTEWTVGENSYNLDTGIPTFTALPGEGSVYDTFNFGGGLENVYSDVLAGTGSSATSTVSDFLTYNGTEILNLTSLVDAFGLSPADFTTLIPSI